MVVLGYFMFCARYCLFTELKSLEQPIIILLPEGHQSLSSLPALVLVATTTASLLLALLQHPRLGTAITSCSLSIAQQVLSNGHGLVCVPHNIDQREVVHHLVSLHHVAVACKDDQQERYTPPWATCITQGVKTVTKVRRGMRESGSICT